MKLIVHLLKRYDVEYGDYTYVEYDIIDYNFTNKQNLIFINVTMILFLTYDTLFRVDCYSLNLNLISFAYCIIFLKKLRLIIYVYRKNDFCGNFYFNLE